MCSFKFRLQRYKIYFEKYMTSKYDSLIVDLNRPNQKLRKNFFDVINFDSK